MVKPNDSVHKIPCAINKILGIELTRKEHLLHQTFAIHSSTFHLTTPNTYVYTILRYQSINIIFIFYKSTLANNTHNYYLFLIFDKKKRIKIIARALQA